MGVKGLTTYLKENRHKLSRVREFRSVNGIPSESVNVVVDGWSLLFAIYIQSGEPWVYGGEYAALSRYAENVISAWKLVGFCPTIVFDGPAPPIKYRTVVARLQERCVKPSNLFFRTSQAARTTPRSLAENRIAPPLGYTTILSTFMAMDGVDVKFAEGEADPYIVTLAGKLQAYVIGKDSDFVVFNSEGYRGYIPLDELVWSIPVENGGLQTNDTIPNDDDLDFQPVVKKKQRRQAPNDGILPPTHESNLVLLVSIYEPTLLAIHVDLPVPLLPLLGAIIGNDYASLDFFRSSESVVERVQRVASTLSLVLKEAQSNNAKKTRQIFRTSNGGAMDVIGTTIERLLLWRDPKNPPTGGEIDGFTETIVQSTLEYAIGSSSSLFPDKNSADGFQSGTLDCPSLNLKERVQTLYQQAYHQGVMHYRLMETFCRGVCFPGLFLEDPDKESVGRSIGGPIRRSIWQLFVCAGGIPEADSSEDNDNDESEDKDVTEASDPDDDELIDVIEEDTDDAQSPIEAEEDPLTVLRGRIQRMSFSESEGGLLEFDRSITSEVLEEVEEEEEDGDGDGDGDGEDESIQLPGQPKSVTEFIRKGSRVVPEVNPVVDIMDTLWYESADKIPVQLRSLPERINVFLRLLGSDTHRIREMISGDDPSDRDMRKYVLWVLSYRWIMQTLHSRCEDVDDNASHKRLREQEKWTRAESEAILSSLSPGQLLEDNNEASLPLVTDRAVQLTAQLLAAFGTIQWLAQALLLMAPPNEQLSQQGPPLVLGEAEKLFSGRMFHANLTRQQPRESNELLERLWTAASEGVENTLAVEPKGKVRGKAKKDNNNRASPKVEPRRTFTTSSSRFSVLADLDA